MKAGIQLRLTGAAALLLAPGDERPLDPHGALIAARLALGGPQNRATLAALLWPDAAPARARANLRQRLLRLKTLAEREWIFGHATLRLAIDVDCLPVDDPQAAGLLEGLALPLSDDLATWVAQARDQALAARTRAVWAAMTRAETEQRLDGALLAAQRLLEIDPLAEAHHRDMIRLHYLNDDKAKALACFEALRVMLRREFDAEPSEQTQALLQLIGVRQRPANFGAHRAPVALQRPPHMVGREGEVAALGRLLEQGGVALLVGEAGIGKTRLLKELLSEREQVLFVKAQVGDAAVPYALLARLLRQMLQGRDAVLMAARRDFWASVNPLSCLLPELALAPQGTGSSTGADTEAGVFDKLLLNEAVARIFALARLAAVAVDDLHFADAASIEMLLALISSSDSTRLSWLFTQRPGEDTPASLQFRTTLERAGRLLLLPVPPLDAGHMVQLLHSVQLTGVDAEAMAAKLTHHCGGNPLFALETLKHLTTRANSEDGLPKPASVLALLGQRLAQLSDLALALARTAAVAGSEFSVELAAHVLQRSAVELSGAWSELEQAQVLRDSAFAHDLVGEAVLSSIPAALKQHLHASMAAWLAQRCDEPARLAAHWLAAQQVQRAAPCLLQAADRAHSQLRPVEEAMFLAQWIATLPAGEVDLTVAALLRMARVQVEAQGFEAAIGPLERALTLAADDGLRVQALNLRAEMQFNRLLPQASAGSAEQAFSLARSLGASAAELAAEALLRWHRALCLAGQAASGERLWQQHYAALETAIASLGPELLSDRGWVLDRLGHVREARVWHARALALAQAAHRPFDEAIVLGNLAQSLLLSGEPAAADAVLDRAEALSARHAGLHAASDYVALYRGMAAAAGGRFGEALRCFDLALNDTNFQSPAARHAVLAHRAMLWGTLGQSSRARADAAAVLSQQDLPPWVCARAHCAIALCAGREGVALALQQAVNALGDAAQRALDAPVRLWLCRLAAAGAPEGWFEALQTTREILLAARRGGHAGLRWAAHWTAAQLYCAANQKQRARRHARACLTRPAGEVAALVADGQWWHGLWQVWLALGDDPQAEHARAAGVAWIQQSVQVQVPAEFRRSFQHAVPAHRALLSGQA